MSKEDWLTTEKLVQLIEKSLSPESSVEHNVKLPDLTSNSKVKRQCDIVIKTGHSPRETITIVEVQSRTSKFNITFFQGLIQKMRDVGAQHLICVSTQGFTKSIKEKARELGGSVRLVKLTKSDTTSLPVFSNFSFVNSQPVYDFVSNFRFDSKKKGTNKTEVSFTAADKVFYLSSIPELPLSAADLVNIYFQVNIPQTDGIYYVKLPSQNDSLTLQYLDKKIELESFECEIKVKNNQHEISLEHVYSYEQEEAGPIAWLLEASSIIKGLKTTFRINIKPGLSNDYIITGFEITHE